MDPVDIPIRLVDVNTGEDFRASANKHTQTATEAREESHDATETKQSAKGTLEVLKDIKNLNTESLKGKQKENAELMKFLSQGAMRIANGLKGILTKSFEIVESIYKKIAAASPLLQAIEQLFNLAWTIFFMPIGNKIGEVLIPAVIALVDKVVSFWEEVGDGGLGEIVSAAVTYGLKTLGSFFTDVGKSLSEQSGWLGRIGNFMQKLGNFIEKNGEKLLNFIFDWATWTIENIGGIITLIGTFMSLHYALQLGTMAVIAASATGPIAKATSALAVASVATALGGFAASSYVGSQFKMAEGGYVPAQDGGSLHLLGEGGEGEYVIPESKMNQIGKNSYTINVYSYSAEETKQIIRDIVSDEISKSRLRSGF